MRLLNNIYFILLLPKKSGNIGSVARVMKNFGVHHLRVVSRRACTTTFLARKMAVHAKDVLEKARVYQNLPDALKDLNLVIGTTGKFHKDAPEPVELDKLDSVISKSRKNRIGVLFGPEDRGLSGGELSLCNYSLTIPASDEYSSLNLSHAAAVVAYELFRQKSTTPPDNGKVLASRQSLEMMYEKMHRLYLETGFLDKVNPNRMMKMIRNIYDRAEIDEREAKILLGILKQLRWYIDNKAGK